MNERFSKGETEYRFLFQICMFKQNTAKTSKILFTYCMLFYTNKIYKYCYHICKYI